MKATDGHWHMGFVRGEDRNQGVLFPVVLDELVPDDHPCRVIEAFVANLDLAVLGFARARPKATGRPPYDPADLLKLYLYGYLNQVRSSRRLERECGRNVEVMWLLNRLVPDHKTIAEFRRQNGPALRRAGAALVGFCRGVGLVRGEWVAIDGSKFRAVASAKAVRRLDALRNQQAQLEHKMGEYLAQLDTADTAEAEPDFDPEATRAALALLRQAHAEVEATLEQLVVDGKTQLTTTEPEARVMKGLGPSYNVQTAVDAEYGLIIAHAITDETTDNRQLQPMGEAARAALAQDRLNIVADAGYSNGKQAAALEEQGIVAHVPANRAVNNQGDGTLFDRTAFTYDEASDTLTCPAGRTLVRRGLHRHKQRIFYGARAEDCSQCPLKPRCTTKRARLVSRHVHEAALQRMDARATPALMRLRRSTVEYPFGILKYQILEKPRLLLRGLWKAGTEITLAVLAYNLKRAMAVLGTGAMVRRLTLA
jgi:transposase